MSSTYKVLIPPTQEPVDINRLKRYMRVDFDDTDPDIYELVTRARSLCETVTGRAWATQTIRQIDTIERPDGGVLSGPIKPGPSWYQYNEQLGANPFGPSQYYYDLAMPPFQSLNSIQTKIAAFDAWTDFSFAPNSDGSLNVFADDTSEPCRLYIRNPLTANFWKFEYVTGYNAAYPLPPDLLQALYEGVAYLYDYRQAEDFPEALKNKLLAKRVDWV
jgi:hypothetical protein